MKRRNILGMGIGLALATVCGVKSVDEVRGSTARYTSHVIKMEKKMDKLSAWIEAELKTDKGAVIKVNTPHYTWSLSNLKEGGVHQVRHLLIDEVQAQVAKIEKDYSITVIS